MDNKQWKEGLYKKFNVLPQWVVMNDIFGKDDTKSKGCISTTKAGTNSSKLSLLHADTHNYVPAAW